MISAYPYTHILNSVNRIPDSVDLVDHLHGFDHLYHNKVLSELNRQAVDQERIIQVNYHQALDPAVKQLYPGLRINYKLFDHVSDLVWESLANYCQHPVINYKNFVCSFNGVPHVGRKLLVSALHKFGWYHADFTSKNFVYNTDTIDGHLQDYLSAQQQRFYLPFFIGKRSKQFFKTINSFGHLQYDHAQNIHNLEHALTSSFLHIASESMATSYCPYVSEKFLYSVVTRGLFLSYAQPGWHSHLEKYYGFRRYTHLFDYQFDDIQNPVERLIELMTMISKFSVLSSSDWHDLYLLEADTVEYNYNHYFSQDYRMHIANTTTA